MSVEFPLAPLNEQKRISDQLEKVLAEVEQCKERMVKLPVLIKRFRQSVLAAACSGRLTSDWRDADTKTATAVELVQQISKVRARELQASGDNSRRINTSKPEILMEDKYPDSPIPESWVWVRFGSIIGELRNGVSPRPNIEPPGIPILRISATRSGSIDLTDARYLPNGEKYFPEYRVFDGDLLFTRYNGSLDLLGVCGMVREAKGRALLYPDKLMRVRFDHEFVLPAYAEIYFQSSEVHERIVARSKSSAGQNGVSGSDIKDQPFALAPLAEQQEIVNRVQKLFALADSIEERYQGANKQVENLTQSILAKAFRGELVPTEAELAARQGRSYESASQLLEGLLASRTEPLGKTQKRKRIKRPKTR